MGLFPRFKTTWRPALPNTLTSRLPCNSSSTTCAARSDASPDGGDVRGTIKAEVVA